MTLPHAALRCRIGKRHASERGTVMRKILIVICLCASPAAAQNAPPPTPQIPPEVAAVKSAIEKQVAAKAALPPAQRSNTPVNGSGKISTPTPGGQH